MKEAAKWSISVFFTFCGIVFGVWLLFGGTEAYASCYLSERLSSLGVLVSGAAFAALIATLIFQILSTSANHKIQQETADANKEAAINTLKSARVQFLTASLDITGKRMHDFALQMQQQMVQAGRPPYIDPKAGFDCEKLDYEAIHAEVHMHTKSIIPEEIKKDAPLKSLRQEIIMQKNMVDAAKLTLSTNHNPNLLTQRVADEEEKLKKLEEKLAVLTKEQS